MQGECPEPENTFFQNVGPINLREGRGGGAVPPNGPNIPENTVQNVIANLNDTTVCGGADCSRLIKADDGCYYYGAAVRWQLNRSDHRLHR